ncbi:MAG: HlyD family type I secretion periplasmic adaptor subunit [Caenispirillum bisanense]|nr:HlyD family type I secretion periplasmic adaptor subunit [Caenispirillum bisanense]MCA1974189.1 HlyD family type I secretion periplasmic adaptor subunit [Caenispirillum sp.]
MSQLSTAPSPTLGSPRKVQRGSRQIRYLAQFVLLEEKGMSWLAGAAVLVVAALVTAFVAWSSLIKIDEVAVASGSVIPRSKVQVVQHLEGGIVRDILVEERQVVEQGAVLARLDPIQATAELEQIRARRISLQLREERLRAFLFGREPDFSFVDPRYAHLIGDQVAIFRAAKDRWDSQRAVLEGEILQKQAESAAAVRQMEAVGRQVQLLGEEVEMLRTLFEQGHASKVRFFEIQREKAAAESEMSRLQGQRDTADKAVIELRERIGDLDNNQRQDAVGELGTVTAELAQVEEAISRAQDMVTRLEVVAPVKGYIQNLQVRNAGTVIPAGGVLMEVVPVDDELRVETKIATRDVGHVAAGQMVKVKVSSYDFVRYGAVEGRLEYVSATTYVDEQNGQPYYKGMVSLPRTYLGENPNENRILPGMTVQADIVTGEKTLLQYLLKPIYVSLAHAFRER